MTELTPEQMAYALADIDANRKTRYRSTHFYEGKSIREWSKQLGVRYGVLLERFHRLNTIFLHRERSMPNYQGHPRSYWAHQLGVTENYVYRHLKKYGNLDNCKLTRRRIKKCWPQAKYLDKTMTQWAIELNFSTQTVIDWFRKRGNLDHLINKKSTNTPQNKSVENQ